MSKLTKKQAELSKLAIASVHAIAQSETSATGLLRACNSEMEVIFSINVMLENIRPVLTELNALQYESSITLKVKNAVTQFIARCRNGSDKLPPAWFNAEKTISFDPLSFVQYQKRATKKKDSDNDADRISKLADERAKTLLLDKAELTKAQNAKVEKAIASAKSESEKAVMLATQEQKRRETAENTLAKQGEALSVLQDKYNALSRDYEKALRQIKVLEKALSIAKLDKGAIDALLNQA